MSARQSLRAVRDGKAARRASVTCEVAPHHFVLTDEALEAPIRYDTNIKMNPPLREAADRDAMLEGIADGTVDVIATDHAPHHADEKLVEFDRAPFGIVGLETARAARVRSAGAQPGGSALPRLIELLSVNPARVLQPARRVARRGRAGRHHDPGARRAGHRFARRQLQIEIEEHAVRRLDAARRRRRDDRRRTDRLLQPSSDRLNRDAQRRPVPEAFQRRPCASRR